MGMGEPEIRCGGTRHSNPLGWSAALQHLLPERLSADTSAWNINFDFYARLERNYVMRFILRASI
jgi:hypothetical protein